MERELEDSASDLQRRRVRGKQRHRHDRIEERKRRRHREPFGWIGRKHHVLACPHRFESGSLGVLRDRHRDLRVCAGTEVHRVHPDFHGVTVARPHERDSRASAKLCRCSPTMTSRFCTGWLTRPMPCRGSTSGRRRCERPRRSTALRCPKSTAQSKRRCSPSCAPRGPDAVLGEEVGEQPGSTNRRWIFDGIDGTHNYADGRPGWGTIIALEVDGDDRVGNGLGSVVGSTLVGCARCRRVECAVCRGRIVRCCRGGALALRRPDVARRRLHHRDSVGGRAARLAQHRAAALPPSRVHPQPMLRARRGDGGRRNARCLDHRVRRHLGLRGHQSDRSRIRRRVPRCVGRRTIRHGHRSVHQRGAGRRCPRPAR